MEDLRDAKSADFFYKVGNVFLFCDNSDYVVLTRSWVKKVWIYG